MAETEDMA